ncbi:MAG: FAD-dependent oxidoreductase [Acidimicrobiia bacterium]|nr:FAD-dependent oxidoreductase [Acidimicrobiia bacterium]
MTPTVDVPARHAEVVADVDVCVAGGGPAGLGAALAAARQGARVCLLERYGFLGGNFTVASVGTICGLYVADGQSWAYVTRGVAEEVAEALKSAGSANGPIPFKGTAVLLYVPWAAKRLFDHLIGEQENVTLFLHALVSDVVVDGDRLDSVVVATKRGPQAVRARAFVDATGDADLVVHAGAPWTIGEPGRRQYASMQFFMEHVDLTAALAAGPDALNQAIAAHGDHLSRDGGALLPTFRPGEVIGAMTRVRASDGAPIDVTDLAQATYGELEGRRLAEEAAAFVQAHVPGFADAFLADTAPALGVRETRRAVGRFVLTGEQVAGLARFDDAVAAGAWPQEYHVAGRSTEYRPLPPGGYYEIPFGALRPQGLENLFVAGRCISADHDALASTRVMAPSMALGQAAGTAAWLSSREELSVDDLQRSLDEQGVFLGARAGAP